MPAFAGPRKPGLALARSTRPARVAAVKPVVLLLLLVAGGVLAAFLLARKPLPPVAQADAPEPAAPLLVRGPGGEANLSDEAAQIRLLEGQVEYLEGQVKALQEENSALLEQLGRIGLKGTPPPAADPSTAPMLEEPDFVGLGLDLVKLRELNALPVPVRGAPAAAVEASILTWLRASQPGDRGPRLGQALHALGWIPEAIDPLPLRAALLRLQLGGWYDTEEEALLLDEETLATPDAMRSALGAAYAQVLREFGSVLFPGKGEPPTLDRQLAREAALAGDAGLTRLLYSLQNPGMQSQKDLPPEDPDHPFNQVPLPQFLRQLHFFPFSEGLEFMQGLHAAGGFAQMNACYSRPPQTTAEVLDSERYLAGSHALVQQPSMPESLLAMQPLWDDSLGQYAILTALRAWNEPEKAGLGAQGWVGDRLLAFPATGTQRGHAVWQTLWQDPDWAEAFFRGMLNNLRQQYQLPSADAPDGLLSFQAADRQVTLKRNRSGQGVLLIDAAAGDFAAKLERAAASSP